MFGNPEVYANSFPYSWEAEQFRAGQWDLSIFTPAILYPDYAPKATTPTYAQAAGSGPGKNKPGTKRTSATEVARDGDRDKKTRSPLPQASRQFFTSRSNPAPHALAQRIASSWPDIAAATLSESNCPSQEVSSLRSITEGASPSPEPTRKTPAEFYTAYFDALSRRLNQSFPVGDNPWLTFTPAPTTIQLAVHSSPTDGLQRTTNNSSLSSRTPSTTQRWSPSARPGTLTRTELLGFPSRPLR